MAASRSASIVRFIISMVVLLLALGCGEEADPGAKDATGTDATSADTANGPIAVVAGDRAGFASVDMSPTLLETYSDTNGNGKFDGCLDDPTGTKKNCDEPFDDTNGNGVFDTAFLAGYGNRRAATGVHDPISATALALANGDRYVVFVGLDVVGLGGDHVQKAQMELQAKGYDPARIIVSSSHTHEGPDVRGMWGSQTPPNLYSGASKAYNAKVRAAIVEVVEKAAAALEPAKLRVGKVRMRERSPWFNGASWGGSNPETRTHGLIRDIRDPIVVADQVLAIAADRDDGSRIATWVGFAGHPELVGSKNTLLSADYVWGLRSFLEQKVGGGVVFMPECLGGMQSGLGAPTPLVDDAGAWQYEADGKTPKWATKESFEHAWSYGVHLGDAAIAALGAGEAFTAADLRVDRASFLAPPDNFELKLMYTLGLFDLDPELAVRTAECPGWTPGDETHPGCLPQWVYRVRMGPIEMVSAPGELFPELFWGLPTEDDRWAGESTDPSKRGQARSSVFFPQHDPDCDLVSWSETCRLKQKEGDCDCMSMHDVPYRIDASETVPVADKLAGTYKFLIGNGGDHLGYILPETDFHRASTQLGGNNGDHYEETVSLSFQMATLWRQTVETLLAAP